MINFKMLARLMGGALALLALLMAASCGVSFIYGGQEGDVPAFVSSVLISLTTSGVFLALGRGAESRYTQRDGFLFVSLTWIVCSLFGMLPFLLSGYIPKPIDAFFETMSGFTTTGATILDNIEALPHGLLFWRSLTQWIGGLGIVLLAIVIMPGVGKKSLYLFSAESSGVKIDKLFPRIADTAKRLWMIYLGLTVLEIILLVLGDMSLFDAICNSFSTTSTGGFSPKQDSIAYYQSPYIEYVISAFMIICGINFNVLLYFTFGRVKKSWLDEETRLFIRSIFFFTIIVAVILFFQRGLGVEEAFRKSLFQIASLHTATGFATTDYMLWPAVTWLILIVIMLMGGSAGSTSGGMKSIRFVILFKELRNVFRRLLHPKAVLPVRVNQQVLGWNIIRVVSAFVLMYMLIVLVATFIMMLMGVGMIESLGCVISSMGGVGPSLGAYGPAATWATLPDVCKLLLTLLMVLGRLELFTMLVLFYPAFWKKA